MRRHRDERTVEGAPGADVRDRLPLERQHASVVLEGDLDLLDVAAPVGHAEEVLGAGFGPLDRPAELTGDPAQERFLRIGRDLGSEAATDLGRDGPDPDLRDSQAHRDLLLDEVRGLVRGPDRQFAGALLPVRADGPAFHRERSHLLVQQAHREGLVGLFKELVGLGVRDRKVDADVAVELLVDPGRIGRYRGLDVDDGLAGLDVHVDQAGGVAGRVGRFRDDDGDRLTDVQHAAIGEQRVIRLAHVRQLHADRTRSDLPVHVGIGVNAGDARVGGGGRGVDGANGAGREVAAHEGGIRHPRQLHIVGVGAEASDQARILAPLDRLADGVGPERRHQDAPATSAACWTASTICW